MIRDKKLAPEDFEESVQLNVRLQMDASLSQLEYELMDYELRKAKIQMSEEQRIMLIRETARRMVCIEEGEKDDAILDGIAPRFAYRELQELKEQDKAHGLFALVGILVTCLAWYLVTHPELFAGVAGK